MSKILTSVQKPESLFAAEGWFALYAGSRPRAKLRAWQEMGREDGVFLGYLETLAGLESTHVRHHCLNANPNPSRWSPRGRQRALPSGFITAKNLGIWQSNAGGHKWGLQQDIKTTTIIQIKNLGSVIT